MLGGGGGQVSKNDASGFKQKGGAADILNAVNMEVTQDALISNVNEELQETAKAEAQNQLAEWEAEQKRKRAEDAREGKNKTAAAPDLRSSSISAAVLFGGLSRSRASVSAFAVPSPSIGGVPTPLLSRFFLLLRVKRWLPRLGGVPIVDCSDEDRSFEL